MSDTRQFKLLMISAMYENGGNTLHRLLDGHPELRVYPFESQIGTRGVNDHLSSLYPVKYRWPVFDLNANSRQDFFAIIDEETKILARTPHVSKFRHSEMKIDDEERCRIFEEEVRGFGRSRAGNVASFFASTFRAWKNFKSSGREKFYVGYSPIIGVDSDKILNDFPSGHVFHVVRNPWSAYADTKKRAVPLSIAHYMNGWMTCQLAALRFESMFPGRLHIIRFEDYIADRKGVLYQLADKVGFERSETLLTPSWNGTELKEVYPWGTIRTATPEVNMQTAKELSADERKEIRAWTAPLLAKLGYEKFID